MPKQPLRTPLRLWKNAAMRRSIVWSKDMKNQSLGKIRKDAKEGLQRMAASVCCIAERRAHASLFATGAALLGLGLEGIAAAQGAGPLGYSGEAEFDPELIHCAVGHLFMLIEGAFGALIMVVSGIGAIMAAAMGAYRACLGMFFVGVGSFILRSLVSLFFGTDFPTCEAS